MARKTRGAPPPSSADQLATDLLCTLIGDARASHQLQLRIGRLLLEAHRVCEASPDGWSVFGVTSLGQLCEERLNTPAAAGWQMRWAAWACERSDELRRRVEEGRLSIAKAAAIARVLDHVQRTGEEGALLDLAEHGTTKATRREVARLREEMRVAERLVHVDIFLSTSGISLLERARDLLTDGRGGPRPTQSHAVSAALELFVDRRCPERRAARARARRAARDRCAPVAGSAGAGVPPGGDVRIEALDHDSSRGAAAVHGDPTEGGGREATDHVPAADWQRVIDAHGDRCWVVGCEERGALQFAHRWHRRFGGPNRWWNLMRLCLAHHRAFDSELLRLRRNEGEFLIVDRRDRIVGRLLPLPGAGPPPDP